jgi:hypothetical protein
MQGVALLLLLPLLINYGNTRLVSAFGFCHVNRSPFYGSSLLSNMGSMSGKNCDMLLVGKNWCRHKDDDVMYYRPSVSQLSASIIPLEDVVLSQQPLVSLLLSSAVSSTTFFGNLIPQAFSVATFLPQPFWILMIVAPNSSITKRIMGDYKVVTLFCLVHLFIVLSSLFEPDGTAPLVEFANVFDPSGNPQSAMVHMMTYPNFVSEEWSHVLTWDLLVGRWIWLDGQRRSIYTSHSVLLANLIGPPGLLLHFITCAFTGKGIAEND